MHKQFTLVLATLALSAAAFAQPNSNIYQDGNYQIGYAANLNIGDSVINISNDGHQGGFYRHKFTGSICANVFVFDPAEEEIACCYCLVTPNGLNSLSAKSDLISNTLTPAVPSSIVIKIVGSSPVGANDATATPGKCDPTQPLDPERGLVIWGTTLEPSGSPNTFNAVNVPFLNADLDNQGPVNAGTELTDLTNVCAFVQAEGTGFGVCKSCRLGALSGSKN